MTQDDPRDVRDQMRKCVMELSREVGADRVPQRLLDDLCQIYLAKGRRAAKRHVAEQRKQVGQ